MGEDERQFLWRRNLKRGVMSSLQTVDLVSLYFIFHFYFYFILFSYFSIFRIARVRGRRIGHTVTSVTI